MTIVVKEFGMVEFVFDLIKMYFSKVIITFPFLLTHLITKPLVSLVV